MKINKYLTLLFLFSISGTAVAFNEQNDYEKSFSVKRGGTLSLHALNNNLKIASWNKEEVLIRIRNVSPSDEKQISVSQTGNKIIFSAGGNFWGNDIHVFIPVEFNLDINVFSGDIHFINELKGNITASTSGGDIKIENISGNTIINSSGGDIRTKDISGDLRINTQGGDIRVGVVKGKSELRTLGGDIFINSGKSSTSLITYGGDINAGDINGTLSAESYGGDIRLNNIVSESANIDTKGGDIKIEFASGKICAKTLGGDIIINKLEGEIDATTGSGDIKIKLHPSANGNNLIKSKNGNIELYIHESSKATINSKINKVAHYDYTTIKSDFAFKTFEKESDSKIIKAVTILNGGGANIELETYNSTIIIKRLK